MNKTYKIQAILLLSIGILLSPSIYALVSVFLGNTESTGIEAFLVYVIYPLPAFVSIMCIAFGVGRLVMAKRLPATLLAHDFNGTTSAISGKEYQQKKNNLVALTIGTILLTIVGSIMIIFVVYLLQLKDSLFLLIFPGAIPIFIALFTIIIVPINVKNILKQKKILVEQRGSVQTEKL